MKTHSNALGINLVTRFNLIQFVVLVTRSSSIVFDDFEHSKGKSTIDGLQDVCGLFIHGYRCIAAEKSSYIYIYNFSCKKVSRFKSISSPLLVSFGVLQCFFDFHGLEMVYE